MDIELKKAACSGDVNFLNRAISAKPTDYFLTTFTPKNDEFPISGNIFHLATAHYKESFIRESIKTLSVSALHHLFTQQVSYGPLLNWNPLHLAAFMGSHYIIDYILNFYKISSDLISDDTKPWLARASYGQTPLHVALSSNNEYCARQIMAVDPEMLCSMDDNEGNSPLFLAVMAKFNSLALEIVRSTSSYSVSGKDCLTPLHVLQGFDADDVLKKLLNDHPELLQKCERKSKFSALHAWAKENKSEQLCTLGLFGISCFRNLNCLTDSDKNTPLHVALLHGHDYFATELVHHDKNPLQSAILPPPAWHMKNKDGNTPFHLALKLPSERFIHDTIIKDPGICYECNALGESTLFLAVEKGMDIVVQQILQLPDYDLSRSNPQRETDGQTVLHVASNCKEETGNLLVRKFRWLINEPDKIGKRPIDVALELGTSWLVKFLLTVDSSSITHSPTAWNKACAKGHLNAIISLTKCCPDLLKLCLEKKDSPLHHIKLKGYKEYHEFLTIPVIQEMMNLRDTNGQTPLHKALDRRDKIFVEVLLTTKGVEQGMKDKYNETPIDMLKELSEKDDEWSSMCKRIGINPQINAKYIKDPSAMAEVRDTVLVVAAFLAALTFGVGFTLPGGLNQDTGEAVLVKRASFVAFVLADAYALTNAMFVMFCLMWSMICDHDKSLILIDRSVVILMQSLYGTLVSFMTGVYTVIHTKSIWASILILVMCSAVAISANKTVLYFVLDNLVPLAKKGRNDQIRSRDKTNRDQTRSLSQLYIQEEYPTSVNQQSCNSKGHTYHDHVMAAIGAQRMAYHARLVAEHAPPVIDYSDDDLLSTI